MQNHYPIIIKPLADLHPWEDNPRVMDDGAMQRLVLSIQTYGFTEPVVWNERTGRIVGGHQRVEAATILGYTELPCVIVNLSDQQEAALNIALNAPFGDFEEAGLTAILRSLEAFDVDLDETALPPWYLEKLMAEDDIPDLDEDEGMAGGEDIECPRCGHHFTPDDAGNNKMSKKKGKRGKA